MPLSNPMLNIVNCILRNKLQSNFNRNSNIFLQGKAFENIVCKMTAILSGLECVKKTWDPVRSGGRFKNAYELLNLRALKISMLYKNHIFQCIGKIFCVEFQKYLWNSTQNILPIRWKMWILFTTENLRALRFKSSKVFLKRPPGGIDARSSRRVPCVHLQFWILYGKQIFVTWIDNYIFHLLAISYP